MSPETFAGKCREIVSAHRGHTAHRELDSLVTQLLAGLGYGEGMAIFIREVTPYHGDLLHRVEDYLVRTGIPASRFGRQATGDPGFVRDLRRGRNPRDMVCRRITAYIAAQGRTDPWVSPGRGG